MVQTAFPEGTLWNTSYWGVCLVMTLISSGRHRPVESPGVALSSPPLSLSLSPLVFFLTQAGVPTPGASARHSKEIPQAWVSRTPRRGLP